MPCDVTRLLLRAPVQDHAVHSDCVGSKVFAVVRRLPMAATQGQPGKGDGHVLLSLTTAAEGTQLHALATCLSRFEPLSHVLAWADASRLLPSAQDGTPSARHDELVADLIELPRLKLSLRAVQSPSGEWRIYSSDHSNFYLVDSMVQRRRDR